MYKLNKHTEYTRKSGKTSIIPLLKLWKQENEYYLNGSVLYLAYKLGLYNSPSLGGAMVGTFREDIKEWRQGRL